MHHPTDRITHTTGFVTPIVEHWLEREIAQWVHSMKDRSDDPSHHERTLLPRSYISLPHLKKNEEQIIITASAKNNYHNKNVIWQCLFTLCHLENMFRMFEDWKKKLCDREVMSGQSV